jgi:hypothetical protein
MDCGVFEVMRREGRADDGGGCATVRQSTAHVYLMFSSSLTGMAGAHAPRRESAELRSRSFTSFNFLVCKDSFDIDASCSLEISTFHKRVLEWHRQYTAWSRVFGSVTQLQAPVQLIQLSQYCSRCNEHLVTTLESQGDLKPLTQYF